MPNSRSNLGIETGSEEFYELLAWVKASERRVEIIKSLHEAPKNSSDFTEKWEISREGVQYHLKQLQSGGPNRDYPSIVENLTPDRDQYQLYGLTGVGNEIVGYL